MKAAKAAVKNLQAKITKELTPVNALVDILYDAENEAELPGSEEILVLSAKGKTVTDVNKLALRDVLGDDTYFALASVGVGDIRKYLNPMQLEVVLTEEFTGARRLKIQ